MKWKDWLYAAGILAAATLLTRLLLLVGIEAQSLLMVYIVSVLCCSAVTHGYLYSITCAVAAMMLFNYLYTEPLRTFAISNQNDTVLLLFFLITAFISATMTGRFRLALQQSKQNEARAEKLFEEKNGALLEAERAHMKSSLLRSIGHDLRTPLTGIQGGSNYIADHADTMTRADISKMAGDIHSQATWLITLVENILYMTRIDNNRLDVKKQAEVVDDVMNEAVSYVPALRERQLEILLPEDVVTVPMDGKMVVQVLVNLLDNAGKYTEPGAHIRMSAQPQGDKMVFSVEDDGPGLPADQRENIFDSFVTSGKIGPDGRKGVGLGLAICRAVVLAHGGSISVEDSPLGGAKFTFWLPMEETV